MPTKAELLSFASEKGVAADESMLKTDIEQRLVDAGYDPNTLQELPGEEEEAPVADEEAQTTDTAQEEPSEEYTLEKAQEQGFWGTRPEDAPDDSEYSLESGPDSPTANMVSEGARLWDPDKDGEPEPEKA